MVKKKVLLRISFIIMVLIILSIHLIRVKAAYNILVNTNKNEYKRGEKVVISGIIKDEAGNPIKGVSIGIQVSDPKGNPKFVDQVTSKSDGSFFTTFTIGSDWPLGKYTVSAAYGGSIGKTSFYIKEISRITVTLSPSTVSPGGTVTISGSIIPPHINVQVNIYQNGKLLATVTTKSDGSYRYSWKAPTTEGSYIIKVSWLGDEDHFGASTQATLRVSKPKKPTSIIININSTSITIGAVSYTHLTLPTTERV